MIDLKEALRASCTYVLVLEGVGGGCSYKRSVDTANPVEALAKQICGLVSDWLSKCGLQRLSRTERQQASALLELCACALES